ncbi:MAG: hypothetical protein WD063_03450 [Pirellulales bacterium]
MATNTGCRSPSSALWLREFIIWLMPIEATNPQANANANNMIDLVRMNVSRKSGLRPRSTAS